MNLFSNREIAIAIWVLVISILLLLKKEIRNAFVKVLKSFLHLKVLIPFIIMALYTAVVIYLLQLLGIWNSTLMKDTILWFLFSGVVFSVRVITSKDNENLFRKLISDNIKIVIIIEFILNSYTFSLIGELILIPIVMFVAVMAAVSQTNEKYLPVAKLMTGLQLIIGILILLVAVRGAIIDYRRFGNINTWKSILLPPLLSIMNFPYLYFLLLYSSYEILFVRIRFGKGKSEELIVYAKKGIFRYCMLSLKKVKKVSKMNLSLLNMQTKSDFDEIIKTLKAQV